MSAERRNQIQWLDPTAEAAIRRADRRQKPQHSAHQIKSSPQYELDQKIASLRKRLQEIRNGEASHYVSPTKLSDQLWELRKQRRRISP